MCIRDLETMYSQDSTGKVVGKIAIEKEREIFETTKGIGGLWKLKKMVCELIEGTEVSLTLHRSWMD